MNFTLMIQLVRFFLITFLVAISYTLSVAGNTYYISTTGSDSNPGTINSPWATLQHAITVAGAGDTVMMRGGTYVTNEVWIRGDRGMGGANGQYLTIKNYPGETPSVGGSRFINIRHVDYLRIEGLHFRMPYRISGGGEGFQVVDNTFEGSQPRFGAIEFFANNGLIEGNTIIIASGGGTQDHGIYLHFGENNIVRNNVISGSSGYGIHVFDALNSQPNATAIRNLLIEGNIVTDSRSRAGIIVDAGIPVDNITIQKNVLANNALFGILLRTGDNINIYHNTIYRNAISGISISSSGYNRSSPPSKLNIRNNIIVTLSGGRHIEASVTPQDLILDTNLYWPAPINLNRVSASNPIVEDPLFVDAPNQDFHLMALSPVIDAGVDVGLPFVGSAPDLGAFEFEQKSLKIKDMAR